MTCRLQMYLWHLKTNPIPVRNKKKHKYFSSSPFSWKNGVWSHKKKRHLLAGKKSHGQVAHGDISLENALLGSDGEVQDGMLRTSFQSSKKWNCWWWGGTFEVWCFSIPVLWEKEVLRCWVIWTKLEKMHGKKFEVEGSYPHANGSVMSGHRTFHPHFEGFSWNKGSWDLGSLVRMSDFCCKDRSIYRKFLDGIAVSQLDIIKKF